MFARRPRPTAVKSRPTTVLRVESLEVRSVPAVVTNLNDSGAGSLRAAILSGDAVVDFAPGLTGTITLTSGEIAVGNSVSINGPGSGVLTVSGNNAGRILNIDAPGTANVVISGLTFVDGSATGNGGAVLNADENLTVRNSIFTGNDAVSGGAGGAIASFGQLLVESSTLSGNTAFGRGGAIFAAGSVPEITIRNSVFSGNSSTDFGIGGAVYLQDATTILIDGCSFSSNTTGNDGGALGLDGNFTTVGTVRNSTFTQNSAGAEGGGLWVDGDGGEFIVQNSTFHLNASGAEGGAIYEEDCVEGFTVENSTFHLNTSGSEGGALCLNSSGTVRNSTITANTSLSARGGGVSFNFATFNLESSIVAGNTDVTGPSDDISRLNGATVNASNSLFSSNPAPAGDGGDDTINGTSTANLFDTDPLLGPLQHNGGPTLTRLPAANSPAVNAGSNTAGLTTDQRGAGFARTFGSGTDIGAVEVQPFTTTTTLATSPNPSAPGQPVTLTATVTSNGGVNQPTGTVEFFAGGVSLGTAPVTNGVASLTAANLPAGTTLVTATFLATPDFLASTSNPVPQVVSQTGIFAVGAGPTGGPVVNVYAADGTFLRGFQAFESAFLGGVTTAVGDTNGDGVPDVVAGAGKGGGPRVVVLDSVTGAELRSFYAFDPSFTGGVNVAAGDVTGDGVADLVVGAGFGGGPHVKVFDGVTGAEVASFFAYEASVRGGVNVAVGDIDGDGVAEIVTGAGEGGPHVKAFRFAGLAEVLSFYAFDPTFIGGVFVAAGDTNGDGVAEIFAGAGAGNRPLATVFDVSAGSPVVTVEPYGPYEQAYTGGVTVAATDFDGDGFSELVTGARSAGGPHVKVFAVPSGAELASFYAFDPGFLGGVDVGGGPFAGASVS
jgi:predicted outer membrane repeat protein